MTTKARSSTVWLYASSLGALALTAFSALAHAQESSYVLPDGTKVPLVRSTTEFGVRFRKGADIKTSAQRLAADRNGVVEDMPNASADSELKILRVVETSVVRRNRVLLDGDVRDVRPVYRFAGEEVPVVSSGEFIVKVKAFLSEAERNQLWADHDVTVISAVEGLPDVYQVRPRWQDDDEVVRAEVVASDPRTVWSQPNFRRPVKTRQATPTDTYFPRQWHLHNTGQTGGTPDADIDALEAWALAEGQDILVAAFDDACDVDHEDLRLNYSGVGHDPTLETNDPGFTDPRPKQINDRHGTAVIGLVVAQANPTGVRGVAHLAEFTVSRGVTNTVLTDLDRASVFTFARQQNVDVHINSWGSLTRNAAVVEEAVRIAFEEGRRVQIEENGEVREVELGMVIVWASGNDFSENVEGFDYSTMPQVIGVGASTHTDRQAIYSNYGPNIDMMAPGGDTDADSLVTTDNTDRAGAIDNGYNQNGAELDAEGRYTDSFTGTSAACPVAAGVAALVLSANPRLRATDVRIIMEHTCDRVNPTEAEYNTVTSRSKRYGYGRINAFQAVRRAIESLDNGGLTWPGRVFNVRVADARLRWQTSVGTEEFLIVESDSPFNFAAKDSECYVNTQLGCTSATIVPLPSGVRLNSVIACRTGECDTGDDQSIAVDLAAGTKFYGIFARNRIGRYSWGVAADSLGNVTDPGPVLSDPTDEPGGGGTPGGAEGPKVTISVSPLEGDSPLTVRFTGNAVSAFPIDESKTKWDFDIDSLSDVNATTRNAVYTYNVAAGQSRTFTARLSMKDTQGNEGIAQVMIRVRGEETDSSGPSGPSALRILVGVPGNPTADVDEGRSPFAVELSVDATGLQGTLQSITWDLGDGTTPRPTSLVVPHTYVNTSAENRVIPITATVTTLTSGAVSVRTSATRLITVRPGSAPPPIGPPLDNDNSSGDGNGGSGICGALGFMPLFGMLSGMFFLRRRRE